MIAAGIVGAELLAGGRRRPPRRAARRLVERQAAPEPAAADGDVPLRARKFVVAATGGPPGPTGMATKPSGSASARQRMRFLPAQAGVDEHDHHAGSQQREHERDEVDPRPHQEREPRARRHAPIDQPAGDRVASASSSAERDRRVLPTRIAPCDRRRRCGRANAGVLCQPVGHVEPQRCCSDGGNFHIGHRAECRPSGRAAAMRSPRGRPGRLFGRRGLAIVGAFRRPLGRRGDVVAIVVGARSRTDAGLWSIGLRGVDSDLGDRPRGQFPFGTPALAAACGLRLVARAWRSPAVLEVARVVRSARLDGCDRSTGISAAATCTGSTRFAFSCHGWFHVGRGELAVAAEVHHRAAENLFAVLWHESDPEFQRATGRSVGRQLQRELERRAALGLLRHGCEVVGVEIPAGELLLLFARGRIEHEDREPAAEVGGVAGVGRPARLRRARAVRSPDRRVALRRGQRPRLRLRG